MRLPLPFGSSPTTGWPTMSPGRAGARSQPFGCRACR
jgi:hypothetical protein